MLIANQVELPDDCPKNCPELTRPISQNGLCFHCPVFICKEVDGESLVDPEHYKLEWALDFKEWFDSGYKVYPKLEFTIEGEGD
jgi:hypothetical protein